jgi:hypothetical protein
MLTVRLFSPERALNLDAAGFQAVSSEPLFRKEREPKWPDDRMIELGILDDDYLYL